MWRGIQPIIVDFFITLQSITVEKDWCISHWSTICFQDYVYSLAWVLTVNLLLCFASHLTKHCSLNCTSYQSVIILHFLSRQSFLSVSILRTSQQLLTGGRPMCSCLSHQMHSATLNSASPDVVHVPQTHIIPVDVNALQCSTCVLLAKVHITASDSVVHARVELRHESWIRVLTKPGCGSQSPINWSHSCDSHTQSDMSIECLVRTPPTADF